MNEQSKPQTDPENSPQSEADPGGSIRGSTIGGEAIGRITPVPQGSLPETPETGTPEAVTQEPRPEATAPPPQTLDGLLGRHPLPTWRPVAWLVIMILSGALTWAAFAELDEVSVAMGEVVPQGRVKVIQHLEGGIVTDLFVDEGDLISQGQELLRLELPTTAINREELEVTLDGLRLTRARLVAEVDDAEIVFPDGLAERRTTMALNEQRSHAARIEELETTLVVLRDQRLQKEQEILELRARLDASRTSLDIAEERFTISEGLLRDGLTHKLAHLDIQAQIESFRGEIDSLGPSIARVEASLEEIRSREQETRVSFRRKAQEQLTTTDLDIARHEEMLVMANSQQVRSTIRSPEAGVVKNIKYNTIGAVVIPGDPIMEVVPVDEAMIVEARLNPIDRGYVTSGMDATVKISTYDYARYGGLDGTVAYVAPDTTVDERGMAFFQVRVVTEKSYLGEVSGEYAISPGMEATVDIHTGTRTVLDYLIRPILKMRHEAFRER
ncbi:MAG: HlyD family type I secretion periplasmic adaptor subunit [Rhodospirillaceae bacterium]